MTKTKQWTTHKKKCGKAYRWEISAQDVTTRVRCRRNKAISVLFSLFSGAWMERLFFFIVSKMEMGFIYFIFLVCRRYLEKMQNASIVMNKCNAVA